MCVEVIAHVSRTNEIIRQRMEHEISIEATKKKKHIYYDWWSQR